MFHNTVSYQQDTIWYTYYYHSESSRIQNDNMLSTLLYFWFHKRQLTFWAAPVALASISLRRESASWWRVSRYSSESKWARRSAIGDTSPAAGVPRGSPSVAPPSAEDQTLLVLGQPWRSAPPPRCEAMRFHSTNARSKLLSSLLRS